MSKTEILQAELDSEDWLRVFPTQAINLGDFKTWIVSREDLILSKLFWAKDSRSEMQIGDVRNLLSTDCDTEYLRSHAKTLNVEELLAELIGDE